MEIKPIAASLMFSCSKGPCPSGLQVWVLHWILCSLLRCFYQHFNHIPLLLLNATYFGTDILLSVICATKYDAICSPLQLAFNLIILRFILVEKSTGLIHFHCYTGLHDLFTLRLMSIWIIPTFSFWIVLTMSMSTHNLLVHRSESLSRTFQSGLWTVTWLPCCWLRADSGQRDNFKLFPVCLHQPGGSHHSTSLPNPRVSQGSNSKSSI